VFDSSVAFRGLFVSSLTRSTRKKKTDVCQTSSGGNADHQYVCNKPCKVLLQDSHDFFFGDRNRACIIQHARVSVARAHICDEPIICVITPGVADGVKWIMYSL
jgi:hypothetical protein